MKTLFCLAVALLSVAPARAQIFGPNATGGALIGGLAGGIIGYNNHHQTGRGIAIGAASGLLLGSIADQANEDFYQRTQVPVPATTYVYRQTPAYYYSNYAGSGYAPPNYTASGALLGGLAGGIIGYNDHYQTGRGILIGTASGLLLGALADEAAREREAAPAPMVVAAAPATQPPSAPESVPVPATAASSSAPASSMSSANSLFGRN